MNPTDYDIGKEMSMKKERKPNIIYVMADQLRYQSCGYAGDEKAHTPNIDEFASQSCDFFNAVSGMPVCCAYRASLFTGKYTTSTGMVINELRMNTNHRCLAHVLTEGGFETAYMGKWHLYANVLGHHFEVRNSFVPPGPNRLGFDGLWEAYNFHHDYYLGYYHTDRRYRIPYKGYEPDMQTDRAIDYIKNVDQEKPFALFLSYGTPHDPWEKENVPEEYYKMFENVDFEMPPSYSDEIDPYGDSWSNINKSPEKINQWMKVYYAMTANLDWNFGRLMKAIQEAGILDNTIVIFTSDHGEMFGAHGRMKKNIFYEEAERVPFLVRWPEKIKPTKTDVCLNAVDIMPTLLSLVDLPIPKEVEGMDVSHCVLGLAGEEPEFAFLQNTGACAKWENGHDWRGIRDKRYTYAIYRLDKKELLFDNIKDPYQINNLAQDERYIDKIKEYREKLDKKMKSINDTFEESTWYRDQWIKDRCIVKTATMN